MKTLVCVLLLAVGSVVLPGSALAQGPGWMGPGMMGPYGYGGMGPGMMGPYGYGGMGPGMMGPYGYGGMGPGMMWGYGNPGYGQPGAGNPPAQITEEQAKQLAQQYADKYLKGFTVDAVLPFATPIGTAYSVELKGPKDAVRVFHVDPWGNVMPLGGAWRRAG